MYAQASKRLRVAIVAVGLAAAAVPAAYAQDDEFIPGYTDFPNALRIDGTASNAKADRNRSSFAPGHTDFPNHLRVESVYDRARANSGADRQIVVVPAADARGFDWIDAGIGAGGAAGVILLAAGTALLALRRPVRRTALAG
jgi:hypothetical protein